MPNATQFRVTALNLNLRTAPEVKPGTRLAVLSQGQVVTQVKPASEGWLKVSTELEGTTLIGFVARQFLAPLSEFQEAPEEHQLTGVHLSEDNPQSRRDAVGGRAFPIGESDRPRRRMTGSIADKVSDLTTILEWLDVEESARYRATGSSTYCNIYACDYCYLAGVYLPRVWWKSQAIAKLRAGTAVRAEYDKTVVELNANSLLNWLVEFGDEFGWERVFDLDQLQEGANSGGLGIICAQRAELNRPGHIVAVVPETAGHAAVRDNGALLRPLQSQAGSTNLKYSTLHWWGQSKFRQFGFWVHV